jgi:hypothetical protein
MIDEMTVMIADMADRIEELEAENAELKAKLARAMEGLPQMKSDLEDRDYNSAYLICKHILEQLAGGKDD